MKGGENMREMNYKNNIYRYVVIRGRAKWISKCGQALNPKKINQKATIHYNRDNYPCFGGGIPIHLYVAHAWVGGYFENAEIHHKDFDRNNYNFSNLEWVTHKSNIQHSSTETNNYKFGNSRMNNGRHVLTEKDVSEIRKLFSEGYTTMKVVKLYHPNANSQERKNLWGRYDAIKKNKSWK